MRKRKRRELWLAGWLWLLTMMLIPSGGPNRGSDGLFNVLVVPLWL